MTVHVPILLRPIVDALIEPLTKLPADAGPHWIVDCTLGGGGHSQGLLDALSSQPKLAKHKLLAIDQDAGAVARGRERFREAIAAGRMQIEHSRMSELEPLLEGRLVKGIMADLGFSSDQIEDRERGLSFQGDGPLDMRLDPSRGLSCSEYLALVKELDLVEVLQEYGEERYSKRIAAAICDERRKNGAPKTTSQLVNIIQRVVPPEARHGRLHPATRTFQALRIVVNEELEELDALLSRVILCLQPWGRAAVLSFHSLEDRKVKQVFKDRSSQFRQITKKPIEASDEEVKANPRSRSAKLRIADKVE